MQHAVVKKPCLSLVACCGVLLLTDPSSRRADSLKNLHPVVPPQTKMPKTGNTLRGKLDVYVKTFGADILSTDGSVLLCLVCSKPVNPENQYFVTQHLKSFGHVKRLKSHQNSSQVSLLSNFMKKPAKGVEFSMELCQMLTEVDIPFYKVQHQSFRNFMEKWTGQSTPHESTLRKNYLKGVYEATIDMIRESIGNSKIWVSIAESTDQKARFVVNTVIGRLDSSEPTTPYLLDCRIVERTNHATVAQAFCDALTILWPDGIKHDRVLLFVSDAARYMKKAAEGLKVLFPSMVYITCVAHGVHRVCEELRRVFPESDSYVGSVKKVFLKAPSRVRAFKDRAPDLALPPQPIVTRWGSWLEAVNYHTEHFETMRDILNDLDPDDAVSIARCQETLRNPVLRTQLVYMSTYFREVPSLITRLECTKLSIEESFTHLAAVESCVDGAIGSKAIPIKKKLEYVTKNNSGLEVFRKILSVLQGEGDSSGSPLETADIPLFRFAPMSRFDVERSFSRYKGLLTDRRLSLTPENAKFHIITICNTSGCFSE